MTLSDVIRYCTYFHAETGWGPYYAIESHHPEHDTCFVIECKGKMLATHWNNSEKTTDALLRNLRLVLVALHEGKGK